MTQSPECRGVGVPCFGVEGATGRSSRYVWVLAAAVVVAALLRVYCLSRESLWIDETFSVNAAGGSVADAMRAERISPPLYYVLLHFWVGVFGTTEAGARSLSVVLSVVAIVLTYFLGKRLYDAKAGVIAACFMAVSNFHIYFAQEARQYALLLVLLLGSMLSMEVALSGEKGRKWPWVFYFLMTAAALHTHFYAVLFVAAENLFFVLLWRENRRNLVPWVLLQVAVLLVFTPWLINMLQMPGGVKKFVVEWKTWKGVAEVSAGVVQLPQRVHTGSA